MFIRYLEKNQAETSVLWLQSLLMASLATQRKSYHSGPL